MLNMFKIHFKSPLVKVYWGVYLFVLAIILFISVLSDAEPQHTQISTLFLPVVYIYLTNSNSPKLLRDWIVAGYTRKQIVAQNYLYTAVCFVATVAYLVLWALFLEARLLLIFVIASLVFALVDQLAEPIRFLPKAKTWQLVLSFMAIPFICICLMISSLLVSKSFDISMLYNSQALLICAICLAVALAIVTTFSFKTSLKWFQKKDV